VARILLAVSGSITAYKSAHLVRDLQRVGHEVRCLLTAGGQKFITPLTLQALSGHPVAVDPWQPLEADAMDHIHLARWAEALLVAPASASAIARLAGGLADDLLGSTALACTGPLFIAPSMNADMYRHPATRANLDLLRDRGADIIAGSAGELACGESGPGRMEEPAGIAEYVTETLRNRGDFAGLRALVSAGPTAEDIDPVRLVTNRSSGRMGFALAAELAGRGARVTLVHGPTWLHPPAGPVEIVGVRSAADMEAELTSRFADCDLLLMAAAVADFRPAVQQADKIARDSGPLTLELEPTVDIVASLTARRSNQVVVGFALETGDPLVGGRAKLERKNLDVIAVNDPTEPGAGPEVETNRLTVLFADGRNAVLGPAAKEQVARELLDLIHPLCAGRREH